MMEGVTLSWLAKAGKDYSSGIILLLLSSFLAIVHVSLRPNMVCFILFPKRLIPKLSNFP